MNTYKTIIDLQKELASQKKQGKTIGFVPTMGALHAGHLSLIQQARQESDIVVCSIFVNPIQFNNTEDLQKYPRTLENDLALLQAAGCDYVFIPNENEMYPEKITKVFDFGQLDKVMEGKFREGHFNGVAIVVEKLFDIVKPDKAYFGEKDFQQLAIIQKMVEDNHINIQIVPCPIMREKDGLAMSSRNTRLSEQARKIAPKIYRILSEALQQKQSSTANVSIVQNSAIEKINAIPEFKLEYFEIVNARTLQPLSDWNIEDGTVGCIAVWLDGVRLIDNIKFA